MSESCCKTSGSQEERSCCQSKEEKEDEESAESEKFEDTTEEEEEEEDGEDDGHMSDMGDDVEAEVRVKVQKQKNGLVDMEDLGVVVNQIKKSRLRENVEPKAMITPLLRKSLEKQGYKLIGTHSGVKLCRWTKSMLRGRGGCYKHTFYGIESHRCMEVARIIIFCFV